MKEKTITFSVRSEDVEYVESIRVYNVKIPVSSFVSIRAEERKKVLEEVKKIADNAKNVLAQEIIRDLLKALTKEKDI